MTQKFIEKIQSKISETAYYDVVQPKLSYSVHEIPEDFHPEKTKKLTLKSEFQVSFMLPSFLSDDSLKEIVDLSKKDLAKRMEEYFYGDIKEQLNKIYNMTRYKLYDNDPILQKIKELLESFE